MLPILLIHGFPFDGSMWQAQSTFLQTHARPILTPNLPGFGNSPLPPPDPETASIESYADFIHQIIRQHPTRRAILAGFSMGGYILFSLLRHHPESIAAAILIDTRAEADTPEARANRLHSIQTLRAVGPQPVLENLLNRLLAPGAPQAIRQKTLALMQPQSPAAMIAAQSAMSRRRDQTDLLPQIKIPTLIIVGQHDAITPPATAAAMHEKIPNSTLTQIPHAGHMAPLEQPQAVNQAIQTFISSLTASAI